MHAVAVPADETAASIVTTRTQEAWSEIDRSEDEVFQYTLYDWYLEMGWSQRLLDLTSRFIVPYLQRMSEQEPSAADLLWRYHAHHKEYFGAAQVQLQLAKSYFPIPLETRVEYLSRAKANVSTRMSSFGSFNGTKQEVARDISDQLDCASVQLELLKRLQSDPRLVEPNRSNVISKLDNRVLSLDDVSLDLFFMSSVLIHHSFTTISSIWLAIMN